MPAIKEILTLLDEMAPFSAAEEWDNSGLQVGSLSQEVEKVLVALDPTIKAIRETSARKAQLLLTHHPLIFNPLSRIALESYPGDVVFEAIINGISIVAAHTNLDVARGGINDMLADLLGLRDVEILRERGDQDSGIGRIGYLPEPVDLSKMTEMVKDVLGVTGIMVMGDRDREITRVAVVGGSGGKMVPIASEMGADLLITGDVRHNDALVADSFGLALIDGGHFNTEKVALNSFAGHFRDRLMERKWDIIVDLYEDEKDPMSYE